MSIDRLSPPDRVFSSTGCVSFRGGEGLARTSGIAWCNAVRRGDNPSKLSFAKLTALFSLNLDACGGGFLTDALVAYLIFRRFGIGEEGLGLVFLRGACSQRGVISGGSMAGPPHSTCKDDGLYYLPSSLFLIAVPFAPTLFKVAILLFLCRETLVEMDVPTRQAYVAAVVQPNERTLASGRTNLARNVFWAVGSSVANSSPCRNLGFSALDDRRRNEGGLSPSPLSNVSKTSSSGRAGSVCYLIHLRRLAAGDGEDGLAGVFRPLSGFRY